MPRSRRPEAAKNTATLIEDSQQNAQEGVGVFGEVATILEQVSESIGKVTDLVAEVNSATNEQAQGIEQVNTAVSQMDQVTQSNAASAPFFPPCGSFPSVATSSPFGLCAATYTESTTGSRRWAVLLASMMAFLVESCHCWCVSLRAQA